MTVDLLGDQSVGFSAALTADLPQVVTATLQAALLLLSAALALLLRAQLTEAARPPLPVVTQPLAAPVVIGDTRDLLAVTLARCLPTRAPPDLSQRTCPSPPGLLPPQ